MGLSEMDFVERSRQAAIWGGPKMLTTEFFALASCPAEAEALKAVAKECRRARNKHPTDIHNVAEGYAIILEELDEFWDEVKAQTKDRSRINMGKELVQVAAMAIRCLVDCNLPTEL